MAACASAIASTHKSKTCSRASMAEADPALSTARSFSNWAVSTFAAVLSGRHRHWLHGVEAGFECSTSRGMSFSDIGTIGKRFREGRFKRCSRKTICWKNVHE